MNRPARGVTNCEAGVQPESSVKVLDGPVGITLRKEDHAPRVIRIGIVGIQGQSLSEVLYRPAQMPFVAMAGAAFKIGKGVARIALQCFVEIPYCAAVVA